MSKMKKTREEKLAHSSKSMANRWHSLRSPRLLPQSDKAVISSDLLVQLHSAEFCASLSDMMLQPLHTSHYMVDEMQNNNYYYYNSKEKEESKEWVNVVQRTLVEPLQQDLSAHYGSHAIRRGRAKTLGVCFGRRASRLHGNKSHVARNAHLWMPAKMHRRWCHRCGIRLTTGITAGCVDEKGSIISKTREDENLNQTNNIQCGTKQRKISKLGKRVCFRCFAEQMNKLGKKIKAKKCKSRAYRLASYTGYNKESKSVKNSSNSDATDRSLTDKQVKRCVRVASALSRVQRTRRKQLSWQERRKRAKKQTSYEHKETNKHKHTLTTDVTVKNDADEMIEINSSNANSNSKENNVCNGNGTGSKVTMQGATAIEVDKKKSIISENAMKLTQKNDPVNNTLMTSTHDKLIVEKNISKKGEDKMKTDIIQPTKASTVTQIRNRSSRHHNINRTVNNVNAANNKIINTANRSERVSSQQIKSKQNAIAQKKAFDVMSKLGF